MKVAIGVISSAVMALYMAYSNMSSLLELKNLFENRRRVLLTVILGAAGFIFVMAAILVGSIEMALQHEAQGFILWNAILSVATGFLVVGSICAIAGAKIFPKAKPPVAFAGLPAILGLLENFDMNVILTMVEQFQSAARPGAAPESPIVADAEREAAQAAARATYEAAMRQHPHGDFTVDGLEPAPMRPAGMAH